MGKTKSICKWDKSDYKEDFPDLVKRVTHPTHACLKCGRAANDKKALCKPKSLN